METIQRSVLANGVEVVLVPLSGLSSVTTEVFVKIGSKYEGKEAFGMSHFLEHMAFKGTIKRKTAAILNKEIDAKGAISNASTGHEWTSFYIKTVNENIPWAIDVLADVLFNPQFPEEEVEKEKGVVIEEIRMYDDNPTMGLAFTFLEQVLKSRIGCWSITGKVEDITRISRQNMIEYRETFFKPSQMVVVMAGDLGTKVDQKRILGILTSAFGNWKGKADGFPKVDVHFAEEKTFVLKKNIEQAHFCLGWPGVSWQDPRRYVSKMVEIMLLGNSSSRLWNTLREDRGLAYYLFPISEHFEETGLMGLQAGVSSARLDEAMAVTKKELVTFQDKVAEEDLARAKDYLLGKIKLSMDQTDFWSDLIGQRMILFKEFMGVEELLDHYHRVTVDQVQKFANDYIQEAKFYCLTTS